MRHQPPVHSPLAVRALLGPAGRASTDRLRALLRDEYAADEVVLCGSGTEALVLAIRAAMLHVEPGAAIAIPAFTCYDVAAAAVATDRPLHLFDIDPVTLAPVTASVERVLAAGARVVVIAPLYGVPVAWEPLARLAEEHGAVLVEDAAQGHGAAWRGRPLGSLAGLGVLSFGRGKGWTGGRGGALLLRHEFGAADARRIERELAPATSGLPLRAAGLAQWLLGRPSLYGIPAAIPWLGLGETRYHDAPPLGGLPHAAARLLLASRAAAASEAGVRAATARRFVAFLDTRAPEAMVRVPEDGVPGHLRFPVRLGAALAEPRLRRLAARLGIARSYPKPLGRLAPVRQRLAAPGDWPGAARLATELITLPTHSRLTAADRDRILDWVDAAAKCRAPRPFTDTAGITPAV
ncbi:MAG TPA: DegT/DnrJ/EryC1/StrS family aminotransferase [Longimicrobiales bacterium]